MLADILPFAFTQDRARNAGIKSGEVRRAKREAKLNADKPPTPDAVQIAMNAQLELVAEQIKRTREVLNDDDCDYCEHCKRAGIPPHHQAQLLKALDTLLDRQRCLLGVPNLAPLKPQRDVKRQRETVQPLAMPVEPAPRPVPAKLCDPFSEVTLVPQEPRNTSESTPPNVVANTPPETPNNTRP